MNINYSDVDWTRPGAKKQRVDNGTFASWVACVMDSKVVRNLIMDEWFDEVLLNAKTFEDASSANNPFLVKITSKDKKITNYSIEKIQDNKVYIYTDSPDDIYNYYFAVYGERKDVSKLIVEKDIE